MFDKIYRMTSFNIVSTILIIIGLILVAVAFSFALFTFGYWLITLILAGFFGYLLPFSWWYSLGAWLITLILSAFILPSRIITSND